MNTLLNQKNTTKLLGLLTILVFLWLIFYLIPELVVSLFHSIFNTLLGNFILIITTILVYAKNKKLGVIVGLIAIILWHFSQLVVLKEGFSWTPESTRDFLLAQQTINRQKVFDVDMIQKYQASQEELDYFNENKMWPWSEQTIKLYEESVKRNPIIRALPEDSVNYARTLYNEAAILKLLSYQTKEGQFLLTGVLVQDPSGNEAETFPSGFGDFAYKSGLAENKTDSIIRCNLKNDNKPYLEKITYTGRGGIFGEQNEKTESVDYSQLEQLIPGFKFLNGPCDPCSNVGLEPSYSCPFQLRIKGKSPFVSDIWQNLWGIKDNLLVSSPSFLEDEIDPEKFPILSELQTELRDSEKK